MKDIIAMAREAGGYDSPQYPDNLVMDFHDLERFAKLVRADERNSWPAEMEAMERQVNILTDALAQERERAALKTEHLGMQGYGTLAIAAAIRAQS